jgi:phage tail-like protein
MHGGRLVLYLPAGLDFLPAPGDPAQVAYVEDRPDGLAVHWVLDEYRAGRQKATLNFTAGTTVQINGYTGDLLCQAVLRDAQGAELASAGVSIHIEAQSRLMKMLPEIYHDNELLGRFLLGFESFWNPLEQQIAQGEMLFDPQLAPAHFLPWLASWVGITWDENLPESRQRALLGLSLDMYKTRGTRQGLEQFLRLYTGGEVKIVEHRAKNLALGRSTRMGLTQALGRQNLPNTFTVIVTITRHKLAELFGAGQYQVEERFQRRLEMLIESQKPAHTAFQLILHVTDHAGSLPGAPEATLPSGEERP